jgi:hypothetical protein
VAASTPLSCEITKFGGAMQAGARKYPALPFPKQAAPEFQQKHGKTGLERRGPNQMSPKALSRVASSAGAFP